MPLDSAAIAKALGIPYANVAANWPGIVAALQEFGIDSPLVQVAAAATVAVETGCFRPIAERRASAVRQPSLYKQQERYWASGCYGRGYIQLTWPKNYKAFGDKLGVDLIAKPELALNPVIAARVLACYFRDMGIDRAANAMDWEKVRRGVNGGLNGWDIFKHAVDGLLGVSH